MTSPTTIARALLALYREDTTCLPRPPIALPFGVVHRPEFFLEGLVLRLPHPMEPYRGAARHDLRDLRDLLRVRRAWVQSQRAEAVDDDPDQLSLL